MSKDELSSAEGVAPSFQSLFDVAVGLCISDTDSLADKIAKAQDRPIEPIPVWNLRAILDTTRADELYRFGGRLIYDGTNYTDLAKEPNTQLGESQPAIQAAIEAFGQQLLEEMFDCLGDDASEKAERFASTDSLAEQLEIITWLENRVNSIHDTRRDEEIGSLVVELSEAVERESNNYLADVGIQIVDLPEITLSEPVTITQEPGDQPQIEYVRLGDLIDDGWEVDCEEDGDIQPYHPIKISPKFIGKYPDNMQIPTCLGKSILVTAFFDKAGAPVMHAGVMRTALEFARLNHMKIVDQIKAASAEGQIVVSADLRERLDTIASDYAKKLESAAGRGYHAAAIVRLKNGRWVQVDPNYRMGLIVGASSRFLDEQYGVLSYANKYLKGLESSFLGIETSASLQLTYLVSELLQALPDDQTLKRVLNDAKVMQDPRDATRGFVIDLVTSTLEKSQFACRQDGGYFLDDLIDTLLLEFRSPQVHKKEGLIDTTLDELIRDYMFSQSSADNVFENLRILPILFVLKLNGLVINKLITNIANGKRYLHTAMEFGMPAFRIGACALSDIELHTDTKLPFKFWASNWASAVTFGNNPPSADDSDDNACYRSLVTRAYCPDLAYEGADVIVSYSLG
ncbi:hypothetical protein KC878_03540 [Candidatus Saccharibacteria bacterium]|nr:hypothetical protein [Candidatus Saccharibacteria bacterium]MCB9821401.1 hypothetical protein [Candidatus Nomurabacteria bacterium]